MKMFEISPTETGRLKMVPVYEGHERVQVSLL